MSENKKLMDVLNKCEKDYTEAVAKLNEDLDHNRSRAVIEATSKQRDIFEKIVQDYTLVQSHKEIKEVYAYLKAEGEEGIKRLPTKIREQMEKSIKNIPESVMKKNKAKRCI